jgi:hypothetical protein
LPESDRRSPDEWIVPPQLVRSTPSWNEPVLVSAAYTRSADDQSLASLAIKAEIGPTEHLMRSTAVMTEMMAWCNAYERLVNIYLKGDEIMSPTGVKLHPEYTCLPLCNDYDDRPDYLPSVSIELDDPRPVLTHNDGTLRAIARRRVYHVVNFDGAKDTDDRIILRSAFGRLADHLSAQLREWYNKSVVPLRPNPGWPSTAVFYDRVQDEKKRLGL